MTVAELVKYLKTLPQELDVYVPDPVQGDCENIRDLNKEDLVLDIRYPALIIFQ